MPSVSGTGEVFTSFVESVLSTQAQVYDMQGQGGSTGHISKLCR